MSGTHAAVTLGDDDLGIHTVVRGTSWKVAPDKTSDDAPLIAPSSAGPDIGFRLVRTKKLFVQPPQAR